MPNYTMPNGTVVNVPEDLLVPSAAELAGAEPPRLLAPGVDHYNYFQFSVPPAGHELRMLTLAELETDFASRARLYDPVRLQPVLIGLRRGVDLPPVVVSRTFRHPPFRLENGFHRFVGSVIMGFARIPCIVPVLAPVESTGAPKYVPPHLRNRSPAL